MTFTNCSQVSSITSLGPVCLILLFSADSSPSEEVHATIPGTSQRHINWTEVLTINISTLPSMTHAISSVLLYLCRNEKKLQKTKDGFKKKKKKTSISDRCILLPLVLTENKDSCHKCATSETQTDIVISFYNVSIYCY